MTSSRLRRYASILLCACLCLSAVHIGIRAERADTTPVTRTGFYFDTVIQITLYDERGFDLFEQCFSLCGQYEALFSRTLEGSDIWKLNHAGGQPVAVSEETALLLQDAVYYSELTNGAVDATIAPLSILWNAAGERMAAPSDADIQTQLSHVDYHGIIIDKCGAAYTAALSDPQAAVDLGFIAKGYIADKLKEFLCAEGVESAVLNLGGNVLTIGAKPDGSAFTIGVQKPFGERNESVTTLSVTDSSLVSSGIYERFFTAGDGTLYHHIIDTKTGYPVSNNLFGVTILSRSSTAGDALSTACLILGLEDGLALVESLDGIEAVFITDDNALHCSSGLTLK